MVDQTREQTMEQLRRNEVRAKAERLQEQAQQGADPAVDPDNTDMSRRAAVRANNETEQTVEVESDDPSLLDLGKGIARGAQRGVDATIELAEDGANAMVASVGTRDEGYNTPAATNDGDMDFQNTSDAFGALPEPESTAGQLASGLSQFTVGMFGGGKILNSMKWTRQSKPFARSMVQGGIADFTAFQENEARLSNMVEDLAPELSNPVTRYLAADEDDGFLEGRMKNAIEGSGLGLIGESLFRTAKFLKRGKKNLRDLPEEEAVPLNQRGAEEVAETNDELARMFENGDPRLKNSPFGPDRPRPANPSMTDPERNMVFDEAQVIRSERFAEDSVLKDPSEILQIKQLFRMADRGEISQTEALRHVPFRRPEKFNQFGDQVSIYTDRLGKVLSERGDEMAGPQQVREAIRLAEETMTDPDEVLKNLEAFAGQKDSVAPLVAAGRAIYEGAEQATIDSVAKWRRGEIPMQDAMKAIDYQMKVMQALKGSATTSGRALNIHKVSTDNIARADSDLIRQIIDNREIYGSPEDFLTKIDKVRKPGVVTRVLRATFANKAWDLHNEVWLNSLLAGPKTHMINQASNALQSIISPVETVAGSIVRGDLRTSREGASELAGLVQYSKDALKHAGSSAYDEKAILDPFSAGNMGHAPTEGVGSSKMTSRALGRAGEVLGGGKNTGTGAVGRKVGEKAGGFVRLPTRALMAGDEFWKQLNYRSKLNAQATREAADKGLSTRKSIDRGDGTMISEAEEYIATRFAKGFDEGGKGIDERAMQHAREQTFTNDLLEGTIGKSVQEAVNKAPALRTIMPFVRTPTNLFRQAWQRTPGINLLQKEYRQALSSPDDVVRSKAYGKMMTGAAAWTIGSMLAGNGKITGSGPSNSDMREKLQAQGWKPYSFYIDGKYHQFERMDPLGMVFGIMGDWAEIAAELDDKQVEELSMGSVLSLGTALFGNEMTDAEKDSAGMGMLMSAPNNLANKTYLKSLTDSLEALTSDDEDIAGNFIRQRIGSYIPNYLGQSQRAADPTIYEMRTVMDQVKGSIPGMSDDLEARRDVFGNPVMRSGSSLNRLISPVAMSERKDDPVVEEMINLGSAFPAAPQKRGNLDLTAYTNDKGQTVWSRWNDYVQRYDLHGRLEQLVTSEDYQNLPRGANDVERSYPGTRPFVLNKQINKVQDLAYKKMLAEEGENFTSEGGVSFREAYRNDRVNKARAKGGTDIDDLLPIK